VRFSVCICLCVCVSICVVSGAESEKTARFFPVDRVVLFVDRKRLQIKMKKKEKGPFGGRANSS